jgi:cyclic pyranopterin phosphate synthase
MPKLRTVLKDIARANPRLARLFRRGVQDYGVIRHKVAERFPAIIAPRNHKIMVAVTALCNARCIGCRYGRDFMPSQSLSKDMVDAVLIDAAAAHFKVIRFYGGEPLLHPDLPHMVATCRSLGMDAYVTTNAILLNDCIDDLYAAGLRDVTIGMYGFGKDYDSYVQREGVFERVERSIAATRQRYGAAIDMQMNWLLMRPTCSVAQLRSAVAFADKYKLKMQIELIHYSLPYFQEGPDRVLQFRPEDAPAIATVVDELMRVKVERPTLINQTVETIRSIPDWLLKGPNMRVPCTAYDMIWIGADGTVQMCYVTFSLGNLHETRLSALLDTEARKRAARDAFALRCPNCHCGANDRIMRHLESRRRYSSDPATAVAEGDDNGA